MNKTAHVTIFTHGTLPPTALFHLPPVKRFFNCPKGICLLSELPECHTKELLTTLCTNHPDEYPYEHTYTFGWQGFFSHEGRQEAAKELYFALGDHELLVQS